MDKRVKLGIIGSAVAVIIIVILAITSVVKMMTPSKEIMPLTDYYIVEDSQVKIILQDELYEKNGLLIDDRIYIDYDTVVSLFNHRFYWDSNENVLTYTTPNEIIRAKEGKKSYSVTKSTIETEVATDYPIVEALADQVYLSLDFVKQYSNLTYEFYKTPNRVVINYIWDSYLFTEVEKATQLRYEPNIKSPILMELPVGTSLMYVDTEEVPKNGFIKVMTQDGIKGYVKEKYTKESSYVKLENDFQEPVYTAQTRPGKINLAFHQVFNEDAADNLEGLISGTKNVNVISPTFFSVNDVSGTISSIATQEYVTKAKQLGLEVWALVDNFNKDFKINEVLSYTSRRDTLTNSLIEKALEYKLNGINVDFEEVPKEAGGNFIQFLRELSVKCRNNGIVLSVDNYVPAPYNEHYDREEQGVIVDYLVVMAYDEHYVGSDPGPVSSLGFVENAVNNTINAGVPKEKIIMGIPFYTRLWKETAEGEVTSEVYKMSKVDELISSNGLEPEWDDTTGCYYIEYQKDGATYRMWQEEDKSIEEKMKVIYNADIAGVAEWKLGLEKESVWNVIERYLK